MGNRCGRMKITRRGHQKPSLKKQPPPDGARFPIILKPPDPSKHNGTLPTVEKVSENDENQWYQISGHPGSFEPASTNTVFKKQVNRDNHEANVYRALRDDSVEPVIPKFYGEVERNNEVFIEMENLLRGFTNPNIMDIKMGTRTFLESEVENPVLRSDLYIKMVNLDPSEPTAEEHAARAITKLRYMQFREDKSTSSSLGFRVDAVRLCEESVGDTQLTFTSRREVVEAIATFTGRRVLVCQQLLERLHDIRRRFESSKFFEHHEIIGSSLLVICSNSDDRVGVWMIDFAKTQAVPESSLTHRKPWQLGNHEDGYLTGVDSLSEVLGDVISQLNGSKEIDQGVRENISVGS